MNVDAAAPPATLAAPPAAPITVLGTGWCEDTALVRSRLQALGVPFAELDVEADADAQARIRELNDGAQVTPTVVVGDGDTRTAVRAAAEPTLEQLGAMLNAAGWQVAPPQATQYRAPVTQLPIPLPGRSASTVRGTAVGALRGRRQLALFLAHEPGCLACLGYARQLGKVRTGLEEADAVAVAVVRGSANELDEWSHGVDPSVGLVADPAGDWRQAVADHVGFAPDRAAVLLLDRWHAARAGAVASEAGGLIDPTEAVSWLDFIALDCPECSGEIAWDLDEP